MNNGTASLGFVSLFLVSLSLVRTAWRRFNKRVYYVGPSRSGAGALAPLRSSLSDLSHPAGQLRAAWHRMLFHHASISFRTQTETQLVPHIHAREEARKREQPQPAVRRERCGLAHRAIAIGMGDRPIDRLHIDRMIVDSTVLLVL